MSATKVEITNVESVTVDGKFRSRGFMVGMAGLVLVAIALVTGLLEGDDLRHFSYAYLVGAMLVLSVGLGGLFFCVLQHLTRSGWSVVVRRFAETSMATLPLSAVMFLPIVLPMIFGYSELFRWNDREFVAAHELVAKKSGYLNTQFFVIRCLIYFGAWILMSRFYIKNSLEQDKTGDPALTTKMQARSAPFMIILFLSVTFAAFDFMMSLDPEWFSTIFGVYFIAGCVLANFAVIVLAANAFKKRNNTFAHLITRHHFHDLGKWLFGFTFFWGYIAFSQYMLIWYASIPEETVWFEHRGADTDHIIGWTYWSLALLIGHFIIPFPGLLSRHVKRNTKVIGFWAVWILLAHWLDLFWLIRPEMLGHANHAVAFNHLDILAPVGLFLIGAGYWLHWIAGKPMLPVRDPRLGESLALVNQ